MFTYLRKLIFLHKKKGFTLLSLLLFALTSTATLALTLNDSKSQKIDDRQQLQYSQVQEHTSNFFGSINKTFSVPNFLYAEPLFKPNSGSDSYEQTISNFFQSYPDLFQTTIDDFRVEIEKPKARNITQVHLFQKYKNIPVFGGEVIFTFNDSNELISYLGKYVPRVSIDVKPKITSKEIQDIVASDLKIDSVTVEPRLFVFNKGVLTDTKESTQLVWRLGTNGWVYFLNANTKEVVYKYEDVNSALNREVYSAGGGTPTLPGTLEISEGDDITALPDGDDAKNAYNYSEDVYNYFYNHFGLDSYDGIGSTMVSTVDYDTSNLATWCNYLKLQDVDDCPDFQGVLFYAGYTVLDITAHEWAHGVNDYAVRDEATESYGLTMLEQSGAMNESYSDIFGVLIEEEYGEELDWDIGEDSPHGIFRSLADPTLYSQPDDWSGYNSSEDSHYNSGIPNKAAYLMMREASTGYETFNGIDVRGMGTDMAEQIFYYALRDELLITSTFSDNLNALLQTCLTLETIEIDTADCESIYDAYTAIGVADGTITFIEANLTSDTTSGYGPLTVNFDGSDSVSFGRNITDYTWDFGDGTTTSTGTTATASHTYDLGSYTATLTITDSDGQTDSATVNVLAYTGGTISSDTTWSSDHNPYVIYGRLSIASRVTLTLEPGVIVKFYDSASYLTINGALNAAGTAAAPVTFTSYKDDVYGGDTNGDGTTTTPAAGDWQQIDFGSGSIATLDYVTIQYGGQSSSYPMVNIESDSVTISNGTIANGGSYNVYISSASPNISTTTITAADYYGVYIDNASPTLDSNTVTDNIYFGVYVFGSLSAPSITNNTISNNSYAGVAGRNASPILSGNTISDNLNYGIEIWNGSPILEGNTISTSYYGVAIDGGLSTVDGNTISNNSISVGVSASTTISDNLIYDNTTYGLYNFDSSTVIAESNWWGDASGPYHATTNPTGTGDTVSNYVDFDPWLTSDDMIPPSDVTLGTIQKDVWNQTITFNWTNPSDADFDHVQIDRTDVTTGTTTTLASAASGSTYVDTGPSYHRSYTYTLYACDTSNNCSVGVTTPSQRLRNPAPTNLVLTAGNASISATWTASSAPPTTLAGYRIYYGTSASSLTNVVDVVNVTATTLTGLTNGTKYYVAVTAYNTAGTESPTSQIRATRPRP